MKKILLFSSAFILMSTTVFSQIRLAPEVGLNISSLRSEVDGTKADPAWKAGLKVGAAVDLELTEHITFQPGLYYSVKGGENEYTIFGVKNTTTFMTRNLEIPLNIVVRTAGHGEGAFFAFAGPYFGFGIGGTIENEDILVHTTDDIDFGSDKSDHLKSFELGLNIGVGYELPGGLFVRGQFGTSLANLSPEDQAGDPKNFNTVIGASIGYMIGR